MSAISSEVASDSLIEGWDLKYQQQSTEAAWSDEPQPFVLWGLELLKKQKSLKDGRGTIVDLGAGDGRNSLPYANAGHRVVALDAAPTALKLLQAKFDKLSMTPPVTVHGRLEDIPLGSNQFDLAIVADTLPQVQNVRRAVEETHRVLKPGGFAIINAFTPQDAAFGEGEAIGPRQFLYKGTLFQFFEADDMRRLVGGLFNIVTEETVSWWDPPHPPFRPYRHQHHALAYVLQKP